MGQKISVRAFIKVAAPAATSLLLLTACANQGAFNEPPSASSRVDDRAPILNTSPYAGGIRHQCPAELPVIRWGYNNYVGAKPMLGCWQTQRWLVTGSDGVQRIEQRVVGAAPTAGEGECKMNVGSKIADMNFSIRQGLTMQCLGY